jgi:hypothetical protein
VIRGSGLGGRADDDLVDVDVGGLIDRERDVATRIDGPASWRRPSHIARTAFLVPASTA